MARPFPLKGDSRRTTLAVLAVGGLVVLVLVAVGAMVLARRDQQSAAPLPVAAALVAPAPSAVAPHVDPSRLLADARRQATAWHRDAVLVSVSAGPLDEGGVMHGGKVAIIYAEPGGQRIAGGAEASGKRLVLSSSDATLIKTEERAGKSRIAPEPNCGFEDAWASARRAGTDANAGLGLRYSWSEKQARPIWEVVNADGQVLRRMDGVSCSILTR